MTLERKTPLKRGGELTRTRMQRKPTRNRSEIEFSPEVRAIVEQRSGGRCEVASEVCSGRARVFHHRLPRGQGGKGTADNGLHGCSACHVFLHMHPEISYEKGWLLRSGPVEP